jgi:hypothetical protein
MHCLSRSANASQRLSRSHQATQQLNSKVWIGRLDVCQALGVGNMLATTEYRCRTSTSIHHASTRTCRY